MCMRLSLLLVVLAVFPRPGHALTPAPVRVTPVRVWDGVFASTALQDVVASGDERSHTFTSVLDREAGAGGAKHGRTIMEAALCSLLDEIGDESRYVEYWWRAEWKNMDVHRDVDEAFCRSRRTPDGFGVQRCPDFGHVLYLDVEPGVRGPTCVWDEERVDIDEELAANGGDDARAGGAPRRLTTLYTVPAVSNRLLRFRGDLLHAVPQPTLAWLDGLTDDVDAVPSARAPSSSMRRAVVLFNTWRDPPMLPSAADPPAAKAAASFATLALPPRCVPRLEWSEVTLSSAAGSAPSEGTKGGDSSGGVAMPSAAQLRAPLLGDACRRGCEAEALVSRAASDELSQALGSPHAPHAVALSHELVGADTDNITPGKEAPVASGAAGEASAGQVAMVDQKEELALKMGYSEHLEAEFFGGGDAFDDEFDDEGAEGSAEGSERSGSSLGESMEEEEEDDDEEEAGPSDAFMAQLAALRALENER